MASPVAHGILACCLYRVSGGGARSRGLSLSLLLCFALLPDLDFLPGLLWGEPNRFHQGLSHSLAAALAAGGTGALLLDWWRRLPVAGWRRNWLWLSLSYSSHLLLDLLGPDRRPPQGLPLLWPISSAYFLSPYPLLPGFRHGPATELGLGEWLLSLLSWGNLYALSWEVVLFAPLLLFCLWRGRGRR